MPAFTSKLQYRTCEKGEYYEEQARTLEETLQLINNFPWYNNRHAKIKITCPSVTITDGNNNWLKLGNYYGRFCFYYLDSRHRFYEYYGIDIDEAQNKVREFFAGNLNLEKFEKPFLEGILKKGYFATKDFNYTVNTWEAFLYTFWICIIALPASLLFIFALFSQSYSLILFLAVLVAFTAAIPIYCFIKMQQYKGQHMHISRANDVFTFGNNLDEVKTYNKADVVKIITTASVNSKEPIAIKFIEIVFKDGSSIGFPNALISTGVLANKFPTYFKPEYVNVRKWILAEL